MITLAHGRLPDMMPVLSPGSHRSPRKGGCFMELASFLAGERWSDHPPCTHPLLAALARDVNDHVDDVTRQRLAPSIPDVIGLNGDDPRVYARIALRAALAALWVASAERQGVMAVSVLRCERVLNELEGRCLEHVSAHTLSVLAQVPDATQWARKFSQMGWGGARTFTRRSAPAIVHSAVVGIATACIDDPDAMLVDLLHETIASCREWFGYGAHADVPDEQWQAMCELVAR
jgi:hypothetical protein